LLEKNYRVEYLGFLPDVLFNSIENLPIEFKNHIGESGYFPFLNEKDFEPFRDIFFRVQACGSGRYITLIQLHECENVVASIYNITGVENSSRSKIIYVTLSAINWRNSNYYSKHLAVKDRKVYSSQIEKLLKLCEKINEESTHSL